MFSSSYVVYGEVYWIFFFFFFFFFLTFETFERNTKCDHSKDYANCWLYSILNVKIENPWNEKTCFFAKFIIHEAIRDNFFFKFETLFLIISDHESIKVEWYRNGYIYCEFSHRWHVKFTCSQQERCGIFPSREVAFKASTANLLYEEN